MDSDAARKRKLSTSGRPSHDNPDARHGNQASYYASSHPPSGLPSLANFVSSVNAGALSNSISEPAPPNARPAKKKRPNGEDDHQAEMAKQKVPSTTPVTSENRLPSFPGGSMFPVRRAESSLAVVTNGTSQPERDDDNENDSEKEVDGQLSKAPGNRGRSTSKARNPSAGGKTNAKAVEDEEGDRGYSAGPSNRGGREESVPFGSGTDAGASGKKGKRNRVHFSCVEVRPLVCAMRFFPKFPLHRLVQCHRRKQKVGLLSIPNRPVF
jgi:hypothetical protein